MRARLQQLGSAALLAVLLSGCPMTDDYFIEQAASGGSGQAGGMFNAGAQGGTGTAAQAGSKPTESGTGGGSTATAGSATAGSGGDMVVAMGGAPDAPAGGAGGCQASAEQPCPKACVPQTERCNGHDDNCNDLIDELACNSMANGTTGCSGFVLATRPDHGYMLCLVATKDYSQAQQACQAQGMRLAWLETAEENSAVSQKVDAASPNLEVLIGANDIANEGHWYWDGTGGIQFWNGDVFGKAVNGAFEAWGQGAPNNQNNEDCGVLSSGAATWGDRSCYAKFAYLCEEPEQ